MMMNSSFELGGCCLARHGAASYLPSKTEEILSRYRPIAPKPAGQSAGMADVAQPCAPTPARPSRSARKRSWDAALAVSSRAGRAHKRPAARAPPRCATVEMSSGSRPSGADTSEDAVSDSAASSKNFYYPKFGYPGAPPPPPPPPPPPAAAVGALPDSPAIAIATATATAGLLEKDAAFMERAAASAVPERRCNADADNDGDDGEHPVTLPLLPGAPYRRGSASGCGSSRWRMQADRKPATLEQLYAASPDPLLLLTDASRQVLWFNPAYERAASALGTPVALCTFTLNAALKSRATLWGFVRKSSGHVIMPQPVRAVGSTVSVECIAAEPNLQASQAPPLLRCGSVEDVERELECQSLPALISDANNRVRWVNSAYKQMVGQPECPWLQSATANNSNSDNDNNNNNNRERMNGEVVLVTSNIKQKLPDQGSFSGRVKIQWTNGGAKTSLTLPSDVNVVRTAPDSDRYFYAWRLDIRAALRLTC